MNQSANQRTAVVLFNLGGPDSLQAVQPFLYNLFSDPDIFRLPLPWLTQKPFAMLLSRRRAPEASKGYRAIGGKSPLLEHTRAQAYALERSLRAHGDFDVHICMRYWNPRADEVVATLRAGTYKRVILLPLYPQYSRTTTGSSYNDFMRACQRAGYHPHIRLVEHWYEQPGYHQAIADSIHAVANQLPDNDPNSIELLFSAHGLPQKIVDAGDPYEQHIRATVAGVKRILNWPHTTLCFQSRVGPLQWLQPYTDAVIREKAHAGARQILVYPIAFVSDHIETLFELGQDYARLARECGVENYAVVPALNANPGLIDTLTRVVLDHAG
jgi:ferrochelatase